MEGLSPGHLQTGRRAGLDEIASGRWSGATRLRGESPGIPQPGETSSRECREPEQKQRSIAQHHDAPSCGPSGHSTQQGLGSKPERKQRRDGGKRCHRRQNQVRGTAPMKISGAKRPGKPSRKTRDHLPALLVRHHDACRHRSPPAPGGLVCQKGSGVARQTTTDEVVGCRSCGRWMSFSLAGPFSLSRAMRAAFHVSRRKSGTIAEPAVSSCVMSCLVLFRRARGTHRQGSSLWSSRPESAGKTAGRQKGNAHRRRCD